MGQWPWPRYRLAQLVDIISQEQPGAIGLDIIFPEPDRTSLKTLQEQFKRDFNLNLGFTGVPSTLTDNDGFFAHIVNQKETVGARYFYFDHFNKGFGCQYNPFTITNETTLLSLHKATGVLCNTPGLENRFLFSGFINNQHDEDAILRQTPLLIEYQEKIYPHLSLSTFMKSKGLEKATIKNSFFGLYIETGKYHVPITKNGYFKMQFNGPSRLHRYISAVDILNGTYSKADIKNKTVFIGSSAIGLNDIHHTVFDSQYPGVEVHAAILENIINNQYIIAPIWSRYFTFAVCILTSFILAALFFLSVNPVILFLGTVLWIITLLSVSMASYLNLSIFISPGVPLLLSITLFSFFSLSRFAIEKRAAFTWYKKLVDSQQLTLRAMVSMVETRDPETGEHINRTQHYAELTARYLQEQGMFQDCLTDRFIKTLYLSVPLHDIGKVGIPDNILLKPGRLTDEEFGIMKTHAAHGKTIIERTAEDYELDDYLRMSAEIAGSHHERWDGKGYPDGIAGEDIPLSGRIMAIADVYDALISKRCYKPAFSHQKSIGIILEGKETLFDPVIVEAFLAIEPKIKEIATKFRDTEEAEPNSVVQCTPAKN